MDLLTFGDAKQSRLREVAQSCKTSAEFASLLNEAVPRLMKRGDWAGTVMPMMVCVKNGCVTWPRRVGKVRRLNQCGHEVKIGNLWYDYIDHHTYRRWTHDFHWGGHDGCGLASMVNQGRYPTYNTIANADRLIRAYCLHQQDVGKTIQIFGLDNNGQPLQTLVNNVWVDGVTITLSIPFGSTTVYVRQIDRVIKQQTQGNVPLFAYDAVNNVLEDLAVYEPTETLPNYERDQLWAGGSGSISGGSCGCTKSVVALVKLNFIPIIADTDPVLISNIAALKSAVQAIKLEEGGQRAAAREAWADAVHELNIELDDEFPYDQTPVDDGFMGGEFAGFQKTI